MNNPFVVMQYHTISVNDDFHERKAVCSCGTVIYEGNDRGLKMAACHRHLADVFESQSDAA